MNCEFLKDKIHAIAAETISDGERLIAIAHVNVCPDCRAALRGSEALLELRRRTYDAPSDDLFQQVLARSVGGADRHAYGHRFWLGTAFGGAIAASLFAVAIFLGWTSSGQNPAVAPAEFIVAVGEARLMDLAFETDRNLDGATISILLSGDVEIEGYGMQRELTWSENLDAGVNRLSLPVLARGNRGGQMIVRMSHPLSEEIFVINLPVKL